MWAAAIVEEKEFALLMLVVLAVVSLGSLKNIK